MLVQYDYSEPEPNSALDPPPKTPVAGSVLKVQGDPDGVVFDGIVLSVVQQDRQLGATRVSTLSILLPDDQPGARDLAKWLREGGDLGIMVI